jgi:hypothetical protein
MKIVFRFVAAFSLIGFLLTARARAGHVVAWGGNFNGETNVPPGLSNVTAIASGFEHSLALSNGHVIGWGGNTYRQATNGYIYSNVVAIAAGGQFSLAVLSDGTVQAWGANESLQLFVPQELTDGTTRPVQVVAGAHHALALTESGRIIGWGDNFYGQATSPAGLTNVVWISAGGLNSAAVTAEGRLVIWGDPNAGRTNVPATLSNVVAAAVGVEFTVALTREGRLVAIGTNAYPNVSNAPTTLSNLLAVAPTLAITQDRRLISWGDGAGAPALSNVISVATVNGLSGLALIDDEPNQPTAWTLPTPQRLTNAWVIMLPATRGDYFALEEKSVLTNGAWNFLGLFRGNVPLPAGNQHFLRSLRMR